MTEYKRLLTMKMAIGRKPTLEKLARVNELVLDGMPPKTTPTADQIKLDLVSVSRYFGL